MNLPCKEVLSEREDGILLITLMSGKWGDPNAWAVCMNQCVFIFIANFLQKFDLKNMILTHTKGFFMGKMVQIRQILEKKNKFKSPDFYNKFQVAKSIEGSWLNLLKK
jgi:hypothetical protein